MTTMNGRALHRLDAHLEVKAAAGDRWEFDGMASVFDVVDFGGDRVARGAFRETLNRQTALPLLWGHDQKEVIGHALELKETSAGLHGRWKVVDTQRGSDAYKLLKAGSISGLSIGYIATETDFDGPVRVLKTVDLMEISLVATPMLDVARVDGVKRYGAAPARVESENGRRCREILARLEASRPKSAVEAFEERQRVKAETIARKASLDAVRARLRVRGVLV